MLGAIVGDIVGSTRELHNSKTVEFELVPKGSRFTDDTVMSLAVAEWLMRDPDHRPETLVTCMQRLGRAYPWAGYGGRFIQWLQSEHPLPYGSFGNGSAMRVGPICSMLPAMCSSVPLMRLSIKVRINTSPYLAMMKLPTSKT